MLNYLWPCGESHIPSAALRAQEHSSRGAEAGLDGASGCGHYRAGVFLVLQVRLLTDQGDERRAIKFIRKRREIQVE